MQASWGKEGGPGYAPPGNILDLNSLKSPFLGFWVIQTGYWSVHFSSGFERLEQAIGLSMAFHFVNGLNLCVLLLIFEVLVLLITSSHYDDDHSSFESNHTHILAKYQRQCQMNAAILGLKSISVLPPKNFKSKFLHLVMKYTTDGVSIFNPLILQLEIFKARDVNPNPGPRGNKKDKINELCPRISLPGNGLKLGQ